MTKHTKELLRRYAEKYERAFPSPDPSEFLKAAEGANNQEATAFVAACLSFGSIEQFMPKIEQLVEWAKACGGIDYANLKMRELCNKAESLLDEYGDNDTTRALKSIFHYIIERNK